MHYPLLLLTAGLLTLQKITQKSFNTACRSGALLFGGLISGFAMLCFGVAAAVSGAWSWETSLILPAVGFGLSYAAGTVFVVLAIRHGSLAKTTLITSYSLLVPAMAGLLILKEPLTPTLCGGIALLILSLWLANRPPAGDSRQNHGEGSTRPERNTRLKWLLFVTLGFAGNGLCSTIQKLAPRYTPGGELNQTMYMTIALALSAGVLITASLLAKEPDRRQTLRRGTPLAALCGLCNAGVNGLVLYLNGKIPASVMFPAISAGQIILVCAYALIACRERFTPRQWAGFGVGILSLVLLNL